MSDSFKRSAFFTSISFVALIVGVALGSESFVGLSAYVVALVFFLWALMDYLIERSI